MSTLVSSAVAGRKAAPKAPARRRQPAPATATPVTVPSATTSVAPSSPPPTLVQRKSPLPSAPVPAERLAEPAEESRATRIDILPTPEATQAARDRTSTQEERHEVTQSTTRENEETRTVPGEYASAVEDERGPHTSRSSRKRQREAAPSRETQPTAKKAKRSSARSNVLVQAAQAEDAPAASQDATLQPRRKGGRRATRAGTAASPEGTPAGAAPTAQKTTRRRKPATSQSAAAATASTATEEAPDEAQAVTNAPKVKKGRQKKAKKGTAQPQTTEEPDGEPIAGEENDGKEEEEAEEQDPELHEIDPNTVLMFELSRDKRHGKTSEREKKMAEVDWAEVARRRRQEVEQSALPKDTRPPPDVVETTEGPTGTAESRASREPSQQQEHMNFAPQLRIVDDRIVEDETTLTIDRQAQAEAEAARTDEPVEEENDLTLRLNRVTWINARRRDVADRIPLWRSKSDPWSEEETDRFYEALGMFGTDFFIISKMFPPKTRKHIKLKFNREEKLDPLRVNAALMGKGMDARRRMDLEGYAKDTGRDVEDFQRFTTYDDAKASIERTWKEREETARREREAAEAEAQAQVQVEDQREDGVTVEGADEIAEEQPEGAPRTKGKGRGRGKRAPKKAAGDGEEGAKKLNAPRRRKKKGEATFGGSAPEESTAAGAQSVAVEG